MKVLYYDRIDVSAGIDSNKQVHQMSVMFVPTDIFLIKGLSFKHIYAKNAIIY